MTWLMRQNVPLAGFTELGGLSVLLFWGTATGWRNESTKTSWSSTEGNTFTNKWSFVKLGKHDDKGCCEKHTVGANYYHFFQKGNSLQHCESLRPVWKLLLQYVALLVIFQVLDHTLEPNTYWFFVLSFQTHVWIMVFVWFLFVFH